MYECNMFSSTGKARFNSFSSHYTTDMNTRFSGYLFLRAMLPCNKLKRDLIITKSEVGGLDCFNTVFVSAGKQLTHKERKRNKERKQLVIKSIARPL